MSKFKSQFKEVWITRKNETNGFSGCGALYDVGGHQVLIAAANADVLAKMVEDFMPNARVAGTKFQFVTIIATQNEQ